MTTLFVGIDREEAIMASDSCLSLWKNGESFHQVSGFYKVNPVGKRMLVSAMGNHTFTMDIVNDLIAKGINSPSTAADIFIERCEKQEGQRRLCFNVLGVENGRFVYYSGNGYDFENKKEDIVKEGTAGLTKIPYEKEMLKETSKGKCRMFYSQPFPSGMMAQQLAKEAQRTPIKKMANKFIKQIAVETNYKCHDDKTEIWILPRKGSVYRWQYNN